MNIKSLLIASAILTTTVAHADNYNNNQKSHNYEVTITNITKNVLFTPILAVTHKKQISLYQVGEPASEELASLAEGGNIAPLTEMLSESRFVSDTADSGAPLAAGSSVTIEVTAKKRDLLSLSAMLLPTNDAFVGLNSVRLPKKGSLTYFATAYDAGSETNDELCISIPGPQCGGTPFSPEDEGEGYVYPSPGIDGEADLSRASYSWDGSVAKIVVKRIR